MTLQARLLAYHDSLGNPESKRLIADALEELSRGKWLASVLLERLRPLVPPETISQLEEAGR